MAACQSSSLERGGANDRGRRGRGDCEAAHAELLQEIGNYIRALLCYTRLCMHTVEPLNIIDPLGQAILSIIEKCSLF